MATGESRRITAIYAGFLPDLSAKEANQYVDSFIQRHVPTRGLAWKRIYKNTDGVAWEVHEGGSGKAILPSADEALRASGAPEAVSFPVLDRDVEFVRREDGAIETLVLPEEHRSDTPKVAPSKVGMRRVQKTWIGLMAVSVALATAAAVAFATALGMYFSRPDTVMQTPSVPDRKQIPSLISDRLHNLPKGTYVDRMSYEDGKWSVSVVRVEPDGDDTRGGAESGDPSEAQ